MLVQVTTDARLGLDVAVGTRACRIAVHAPDDNTYGDGGRVERRRKHRGPGARRDGVAPVREASDRTRGQGREVSAA